MVDILSESSLKKMTIDELKNHIAELQEAGYDINLKAIVKESKNKVNRERYLRTEILDAYEKNQVCKPKRGRSRETSPERSDKKSSQSSRSLSPSRSSSKSRKNTPSKDQIIKKLKKTIKGYMQEADGDEIEEGIVKNMTDEQVNEFIDKNKNRIEKIAQQMLDEEEKYDINWELGVYHEYLEDGKILKKADEFIVKEYSKSSRSKSSSRGRSPSRSPSRGRSPSRSPSRGRSPSRSPSRGRSPSPNRAAKVQGCDDFKEEGISKSRLKLLRLKSDNECDLKTLSQEYNIAGRSKMNKDQLIEAIIDVVGDEKKPVKKVEKKEEKEEKKPVKKVEKKEEKEEKKPVKKVEKKEEKEEKKPVKKVEKKEEKEEKKPVKKVEKKDEKEEKKPVKKVEKKEEKKEKEVVKSSARYDELDTLKLRSADAKVQTLIKIAKEAKPKIPKYTTMSKTDLINAIIEHEKEYNILLYKTKLENYPKKAKSESKKSESRKSEVDMKDRITDIINNYLDDEDDETVTLLNIDDLMRFVKRVVKQDITEYKSFISKLFKQIKKSRGLSYKEQSSCEKLLNIIEEAPPKKDQKELSNQISDFIKEYISKKEAVGKSLDYILNKIKEEFDLNDEEFEDRKVFMKNLLKLEAAKIAKERKVKQKEEEGEEGDEEEEEEEGEEDEETKAMRKQLEAMKAEKKRKEQAKKELLRRQLEEAKKLKEQEEQEDEETQAMMKELEALKAERKRKEQAKKGKEEREVQEREREEKERKEREKSEREKSEREREEKERKEREKSEREREEKERKEREKKERELKRQAELRRQIEEAKKDLEKEDELEKVEKEEVRDCGEFTRKELLQKKLEELSTILKRKGIKVSESKIENVNAYCEYSKNNELCDSKNECSNPNLACNIDFGICVDKKAEFKNTEAIDHHGRRFIGSSEAIKKLKEKLDLQELFGEEDEDEKSEIISKPVEPVVIKPVKPTVKPVIKPAEPVIKPVKPVIKPVEPLVKPKEGKEIEEQRQKLAAEIEVQEIEKMLHDIAKNPEEAVKKLNIPQDALKILQCLGIPMS
jgi:hypothetical protein